jgi:transcriptional regulator PpsR
MRPMDAPLSKTKSLYDGLEHSDLIAILQTAADMALVLNAAGKVVAASYASPDLKVELGGVLRGRRLVDSLTEDSREKLEELLHVGPGGGPLVRDLVHRLADGSEVPVRYSAVSLAGDGRVAMLGRDQRAIAALQQQVLDAQKALEQDYWRLRQVEARYRLLFQMAGDPVLIVDEASRRVLEANPLADKLLGVDGKSIIGRVFPTGLDAAGAAAVRNLLLEAAAVGRASVAGVHALEDAEAFSVSATLLRQGDESRFLLRLTRPQAAAQPAGGRPAACIDSVLRDAPDAVVLTDSDGRIRSANATFLQLAQLASEEQVIGRSIDRWLGRSGVDLNVLLNNLRQHASVRLFATKLRSELGTTADVEISVGPYADGDERGFAFFIRDVGRRIAGQPAIAARLPSTVEQITQQVGRVPLKDLVRQSTDLVEKLCIETALELTGDNRASAAELLGLSRQGLYAKLHRYNLGEKGADD